MWDPLLGIGVSFVSLGCVFLGMVPPYLLCVVVRRLGPVLPDTNQARVLEALTDPHTGKALVIANQSRNTRSNTRRSECLARSELYT